MSSQQMPALARRWACSNYRATLCALLATQSVENCMPTLERAER
ncbi:Unknown protein sequence [Pseudomonas syringae pv. syringae]|nr:Unknown protein sequence [Pseudomonas syringae pv. syringae]